MHSAQERRGKEQQRREERNKNLYCYCTICMYTTSDSSQPCRLRVFRPRNMRQNGF